MAKAFGTEPDSVCHREIFQGLSFAHLRITVILAATAFPVFVISDECSVTCILRGTSSHSSHHLGGR